MHQLAVAYKSLRNLQSADTASAAVTGCETREWLYQHGTHIIPQRMLSTEI
jgi:hypothetical protein